MIWGAFIVWAAGWGVNVALSRSAIGATRGQLVAGLLLETGLTTLLGSLAGVMLAASLAPLFGRLFTSLLVNSAGLAVTPGLAGAVLGLFLGLSLLFGLLPALIW